MQIQVDVRRRELLLYQDDQLVRRYPVTDFKKDLPAGRFTIIEKSICSVNEGLGTRWLCFSKQPLGIHGPAPEHHLEPCLGICMQNLDLEGLYSLVPLGTLVEICKAPPEPQALALPNQFGRFPATPLAFPLVSGPCSYIVQKGDTIWKLSRRLKIPLESILAANLLSDPNYLEPGQVINLPLPWPHKK